MPTEPRADRRATTAHALIEKWRDRVAYMQDMMRDHPSEAAESYFDETCPVVEGCADELDAALRAEPVSLQGAPHRCARCGHRWDGLPGAEYCGDCHRVVQVVSPQGWQPIETAPKDMDVLLLYEDGAGVQPGYWYDLDDEHRWLAVETQGLTGGRMRPTHWMLLPASPRT